MLLAPLVSPRHRDLRLARRSPVINPEDEERVSVKRATPLVKSGLARADGSGKSWRESNMAFL